MLSGGAVRARSVTPLAGLVTLGLGAHAWLLATGGAPAPDGVRLGVAFAVLLLLPGYAFVALGAPPAGGMWLSAPWAFGFGVAWNGALILGARALGLPFTGLAAATLPANAILWGAVLARRARVAAAEARRDGLPAAALAAILLAALAAALHAGHYGTPITCLSDSPDHIGTIRRMLAGGDAFPANAFFRDAGAAGVDPRKGLWHPEVALLCRLAALDPYDAWRLLPACVAPLFALTAAGLGVLIGGPVAAAVAAWALVLTYGGSLAGYSLREAGFATKVADQLALLTTVAVLADLARPRRSGRLAAVGVALGALAAHVFAAIQFATVFTALLAGLILRDRRVGPEARRLFGTALAIGVACLPYLLWRMHGAYAPANPIHTEVQGLLTLWPGARVVFFGVLWDWLGRLWILFPLSWWALWRHGRAHPATLYLLTTSVAVALVMFDPPAVALLEPRVGYLLMRWVWLLPLAGLLAWLLPGIARRIAGGGPGRAVAWIAAAVVAALLMTPLRDALDAARHAPGLYAEERLRNYDATRADLTWLDRHLLPGQVVLSDPATSYAIPMFTRHFIVTLADQHSSPNDPRALTRILDARDALDPYARWERTREVIERYGVTVVVLDTRYGEIPPLDYWAPSPEWFAAARARFDAQPAAFERLTEDSGFVAYRVDREALAALHGAAPRPFVAAFDARRFPVARRLGPGLPALQGFRLFPSAAAPGDTVRGVAEWRVLEPLAPGSYRVYVRFDRPLPGGLEPPVFAAKPARKILEHTRHELYRFRSEHLPVAGAYGVDLWRPDEVVRDSFAMEVPRDAAGGTFQVHVQMMHAPHYPNLRLADYFSDHDAFEGVPAGWFRVRRPGARDDTPLPEPGGH